MHSKGRHLSYNFLSSICRISQAVATASDYYVVTPRMTTWPFFPGAVLYFIVTANHYSNKPWAIAADWTDTEPSLKEHHHLAKLTTKLKPERKHPSNPLLLCSPLNSTSGIKIVDVTHFFATPLKLDSQFPGLHAQECTMKTGYPVPPWATSACGSCCVWSQGTLDSKAVTQHRSL